MKKIFHELVNRFRRVINSTRAEMPVSDLPIVKIAEVVIGSTTYFVSSFFKKDAKSNVVDKVKRLIEREAENITEKQ